MGFCTFAGKVAALQTWREQQQRVFLLPKTYLELLSPSCRAEPEAAAGVVDRAPCALLRVCVWCGSFTHGRSYSYCNDSGGINTFAGQMPGTHLHRLRLQDLHQMWKFLARVRLLSVKPEIKLFPLTLTHVNPQYFLNAACALLFIPRLIPGLLKNAH